MALKKIRIMEPYGFQDQNDFDPTNCRCEDDIKDIKKVNDAQTDEINSILSGKADASLVEELSAITDAYLIELEKLEDKDKELEQLINDEEEARKLQKKLAKNQFDFNDFLKQIQQISIFHFL